MILRGEMRKMKKVKEERIVQNMAMISIGGNTFLSIFKLIGGFVGHSGAMISDAIHSLSDVFSTIIAIVGIKISKKAADKSHPYGHERLECIASIILCAVLFIAGVIIGYQGIVHILEGNYETIESPHMLALVAAIISVIGKELMYQYTMYYAKKINSSVFMADAWHHRSDALSSIGAFIGIGGTMLGYAILEPIASVIICLFIIKASYDIFMDAINKLVDTPCSEELEQDISEYIAAHEGVVKLDLLQTRRFGNKVYIDVEIQIDGNMLLRDAHAIAERIHDGVEEKFENIKHIMIHVNPSD